MIIRFIILDVGFAAYHISCVWSFYGSEYEGPQVVYTLYRDGHNNCQRRKIGTYQTNMVAFLKAHAVQQAKEAEITNGKYEGSDVIDYMYCQATKVNDVYVSSYMS